MKGETAERQTQGDPRKLPHLSIINSNLSPLPIKMPKEGDDKRQAAREVIDILQEISDLLVRASVAAGRVQH